MKKYVIEVTDILVKRIIMEGDDEDDAEAWASGDSLMFLSDEDDIVYRKARCLREASNKDIEKYYK